MYPVDARGVFLATGTFQHHLHHGSLSYTEPARVHELVSDGMSQAGRDAISVLMSDNYQKYFDTRLGLLPDRSVITFRRIENHQHGCPEVVDQNEAPAVAELVRRIKSQIAESTPRPPAAAPPVAAPPEEARWGLGSAS